MIDRADIDDAFAWLNENAADGNPDYDPEHKQTYMIADALGIHMDSLREFTNEKYMPMTYTIHNPLVVLMATDAIATALMLGVQMGIRLEKVRNDK